MFQIVNESSVANNTNVLQYFNNDITLVQQYSQYSELYN